MTIPHLAIKALACEYEDLTVSCVIYRFILSFSNIERVNDQKLQSRFSKSRDLPPLTNTVILVRPPGIAQVLEMHEARLQFISENSFD